jgi:hypothetical protein
VHVAKGEMREHSKLGKKEVRLESRMKLASSFTHKARYSQPASIGQDFLNPAPSSRK